jgi:hypothetical protein
MKKRFFLLERIVPQREETIMHLGKPNWSAHGAL